MNFKKELDKLQLSEYRKSLLCFTLQGIQYRINGALNRRLNYKMKNYTKDTFLFATFSDSDLSFLLGTMSYNSILESVNHIIFEVTESRNKRNRAEKWKITRSLLNYNFNRHINIDAVNPKDKSITVGSRIAQYRIHQMKNSTSLDQFNQLLKECSFTFDKILENFNEIPRVLIEKNEEHYFKKNPTKVKNGESIKQCMDDLQSYCNQIKQWNRKSIAQRMRDHCCSPEFYNGNITRSYSLLVSIPSWMLNYLYRDGKRCHFIDVDIVSCHATIVMADILTNKPAGYEKWEFTKVTNSDTDIYNHIATSLEIIDGRDKSKELFNICLNGNPSEQRLTKVSSVYPDICKYILTKKYAQIKKDRNHATKSATDFDELRSSRIYGDYLRSAEAQFMFNDWCKSNQDVIQLTRHDGTMVLVEGQDYETICKQFRKAVANHFGTHAKVKIKELFGLQIDDNVRMKAEYFIDQFNNPYEPTEFKQDIPRAESVVTKAPQYTPNKKSIVKTSCDEYLRTSSPELREKIVRHFFEFLKTRSECSIKKPITANVLKRGSGVDGIKDFCDCLTRDYSDEKCIIDPRIVYKAITICQQLNMHEV